MKNTFRELPKKRWRGLEEEELIQQAFEGNIPKGSYIENFELDFLKFKLPPHLEERLIPQQLLLMKVADQAVRDAKLEQGGRVAVLVAMGTELELHQIRARVNLGAQFESLWQEKGNDLTEEQKQSIELQCKNSIHHKARLNQYTSAIGNIMASRISSLWDFSGPAFTVSAEENSVFQALELAQLMFERGEADSVVLAAVDLSASMESLLLRQQFGEIHKEGNVLSFDQSSQGWAVGEGAGAIVLKASEKIQKNERVYAQIDALKISDSYTNQSLEDIASKALEKCDYRFDDIEYWELNASGFKEQDVKEQKSILAMAVADESDKTKTRKTTAIGSVKNNIGHCFSASGIASIIKTALCLHNRIIPGVNSWTAPQEQQSGNLKNWEESRLYIPSTTKTWFRDAGQSWRSAAVNSYSIDGRLAFLAMSESRQESLRENNYINESEVQLFSVREDSVEAVLERLVELKVSLKNFTNFGGFASEYFKTHTTTSKARLCLSLVATNAENLAKEIQLAEIGLKKLQAEPAGEKSGKEWFSPSGSYFTTKPLAKNGKVAFVYPGAFNSYLNIAKDLGVLFPELHDMFANHSEQAATLFADQLYYPRHVKALTAEEEKQLQRKLPEQAISSFENGISVSVALTDVFKNIFKVQPDLCFGYSMGEVSMMYAMNVWDTTDVMSQRLRENPVFQTRLAGPMETLREAWSIKSDHSEIFWTGRALLAPVEKIKEAVQKEEFVRLILINTENEAVIAGKPDACKRVAEELACESFEAALGDVIHCDWVRPEFKLLADLHILDVNKVKEVDFLTAVGNKKLSISSEGVATNIAEMYCNPVNFVELSKKAYEEGARVFIELGARDNCSRYIGDILAGQEHVCIPVNRKGSSDKANIFRALARMNSHGVDLDLSRLYKQSDLPKDAPKKQLLIDIEVGAEPLFNVLDGLKSIVSDKSNIAVAEEKNEKEIKAFKKEIPKKSTQVNTQKPVVQELDANSESEKIEYKAKESAEFPSLESAPDKELPLKDSENNIYPMRENSRIPKKILDGFNQTLRQFNSSHETFLQARSNNISSMEQVLGSQIASLANGSQAYDFSDSSTFISS